MRLFFASLVAAVLVLCAFGPPRLENGAAAGSFEVTSQQLTAIHAQRVDGLTARSAVLVDLASNRVLWGRNQNLRLPQASTTKIMTALLTLENRKLSDLATVSAAAAAVPGTRMGLAAGEVLTVDELLHGLLLPSGNDAAMVLSSMGETTASFVNRMNARAAQLGLKNTHFVNPDGLDDPNHYSSAFDLAELSRFELDTQPLFASIVRTKHWTLAASAEHPAFDLTNLNQLLGSYPGADGVKTGTTPAAGEVLVGSATRNGRRLLAVVMASQDRYADATLLLDHGFQAWVWPRPAQFLPPGFSVSGAAVDAPFGVPAWEAGQLEAFLDVDTMEGQVSLMGNIVSVTALSEAQ